MALTTFETFDLVSEEPFDRLSERKADRPPQDTLGAVYVRQRHRRPVREWQITIANATRGQMRRIRDLWQRTNRGLLPMAYTHPDDGLVTVVFADDSLELAQDSYGSGQIRVTLREAF